MKVVSRALAVALIGLLAACVSDGDSNSGLLHEIEDLNTYSYADARRLGQVFKIVEKSGGRSYRNEDRELLAEHCDTDQFICFNTSWTGLEFAVPRDGLVRGDSWKHEGATYTAKREMHMLWQAKARHFFMIESKYVQNENIGERTNLYVFNYDDGLVLMYIGLKKNEICTPCTQAIYEYVLVNGGSGFK